MVIDRLDMLEIINGSTAINDLILGFLREYMAFPGCFHTTDIF